MSGLVFEVNNGHFFSGHITESVFFGINREDYFHLFLLIVVHACSPWQGPLFFFWDLGDEFATKPIFQLQSC